MIKTSIEKLANGIGFDIALSNDETQADLLNGFFEGLANSMQDENKQTQLCYIADKLTPKTMKTIGDLMAFIELKEKEV